MKDYKTRLIIFLFLAIVISLFPPFELAFKPVIDSSIGANVVYGKSYIFIFESYHSETSLFQIVRGIDYAKYMSVIMKRRLLIDELIIEYLLAGFIASFVQVIVVFAKRKRDK